MSLSLTERGKIGDSEVELVCADSVFSEKDVKLLHTVTESPINDSILNGRLDSFQSLSMNLNSELLLFTLELENVYRPSMSSDFGRDTSEISDALFEAELIKFLESFGVDESKKADNNDKIDDLFLPGGSNIPARENREEDVDEFLRSMQMMEEHLPESDTKETEESSGWFGSFGGIVKGVVHESVYKWQSFGKEVKKKWIGGEDKNEDLIDLSSEEDNSLTFPNKAYEQHHLDLVNDNTAPSVTEEESQTDAKNDEKTADQNPYYDDLKTFGNAMKTFLNKGLSSLQPNGEEDTNTLKQDQAIKLNEETEEKLSEYYKAQISDKMTFDVSSTSQESLIDSVMHDMTDPITSIRHLYETEDDPDLRRDHCEQEVADVVEYVVKASNSAKEVLQAYQTWLPIRKDTIKKLQQIAKSMDESGRDAKFLDTIGIGSGLAGSAVALTGLLLAPITGGIATGLIVKGGLMAGVGGVTSAGAAIGGSLSMKEKLKEAEQCINEDREKTDILFERLRNHASIINHAQESIEKLRQGILLLLCQGVKFGAKTRKLLCIGMNVIKHNKKSVGNILKRLGLPGIKTVNKKVAAFNIAKAGAPTMLGVKAVKAMRVGHSLVPYLFMATAVWESMELYSTVSSLLRGDSVPEATELKKLIDNLESEIQDITNEIKELGILLDDDLADDPDVTLQTTSLQCDRCDQEKVSEINNNTSDEDSSLPSEMKSVLINN